MKRLQKQVRQVGLIEHKATCTEVNDDLCSKVLTLADPSGFKHHKYGILKIAQKKPGEQSCEHTEDEDLLRRSVVYLQLRFGVVVWLGGFLFVWVFFFLGGGVVCLFVCLFVFCFVLVCFGLVWFGLVLVCFDLVWYLSVSFFLSSFVSLFLHSPGRAGFFDAIC